MFLLMNPVELHAAYRLDRDSNGGVILLYVREDIPSNLIAM